MDVLKCWKCGTFLYTDEQAYKRLEEETIFLNKEIEKLEKQAKTITIKSKRSTINSKIQKLGMKRSALKEEKRQLQILIHQKNEGEDGYIIRQLLIALKSKGVTKEEIAILCNMGREEYLKMKSKTENSIKEKYGALYEDSNHNTWHNGEGVYDSTAKLALDKAR